VIHIKLSKTDEKNSYHIHFKRAEVTENNRWFLDWKKNGMIEKTWAE